MATNNRNVTLTGLARRFVDDGLLDEETAKDAFLQASQNRIPLITYLTQNQLAGQESIVFWLIDVLQGKSAMLFGYMIFKKFSAPPVSLAMQYANRRSPRIICVFSHFKFN